MGSSDPSGTGAMGGAIWLLVGRYDRKRLMASMASRSLATTTSANPECSASTCQPPSSSPLTTLPSDIETTRGLATAMTAPLRITQKSEQHACHAADPNAFP